MLKGAIREIGTEIHVLNLQICLLKIEESLRHSPTIHSHFLVLTFSLCVSVFSLLVVPQMKLQVV